MIEGTWKLIGGEMDGRDIPATELEQSKLEIVGDQHTVTLGEEVRKGTHTLNTEQSPMTIDTTDSVGPATGHKLLGIFKVEDDVFTVCFAAPDGERPSEFTTKDGKAAMLHRWKRN